MEVTSTSTDIYSSVYATESDEAIRVSYPKRFDARRYLVSVGCLGVLDNAFVITVVVFYTSMTKRLTGRLILNQSCVDMVASLMVVIRQSNNLVRGYTVPFDGFLGELYCRLWLTGGIQWIFILSSTANLVMITIERYISVVFPIHHKRYCTKKVATPVIVCVWLFGVAFEMGWCAPSSEAVGELCVMMGFNGNAQAYTIYGTTSVVIYFFVPITCMIFCYTHMVLTLRRKARAVMPANVSAGTGSKSTQLSAAQRSLFKTMFMVSASFVVCWSWYEIVWLCLSSNIMFFEMVEVLDYSQLLAITNLVINPFIYIFHYQEFRKGLQKIRHRHFPVSHLQETTSDDGSSRHTLRS